MAKHKDQQETIARATFREAVVVAQRTVASVAPGREHVVRLELASGLLHIHTDKGEHIGVPISNVGYVHFEPAPAPKQQSAKQQEDPADALQAQQAAGQTQPAQPELGPVL
jgi:hypothetical protein